MDEQKGYLVVYKPPGLHSAPLKNSSGPTLVDWCAGLFPEIRKVQGRLPWEGGLLHRLDYETGGLLLLARCQTALEALLVQQEEGRLIKEYEAWSAPVPSHTPEAGFPPPPETFASIIESGFRSYGPGGKAVRPVQAPFQGAALDRGKPYLTELTASTLHEEHRAFTLRLRRGFRHQIRCHLAWIGFPLLNDALYGGPAAALPGGVTLALRAQGLNFTDPLSGEARSYRFP